MTNIQIYKANGTLLYSAPITKDALFRHELMTEEYVQLVFNEVSQVDFPIGCYLEHEGRKYVVTTLVYPELIDGGYKYSIRFEAEWMRWRNITCFFVNEFTGKPEANWSDTSTPGTFLSQVTKNISRAIGQTYTFAYDSSLTATKDLTFDNKTVLEALSMIAEAFETEWWVDGSVIHLSRCEHGEAVVLTQGVNIGAPTSSGESEYATRIYAYGSTRNITQDYQSGGTTNALVEKRLTLPVDRYPNGYRDIKAGLSAAEIIEKTVIFDDIYPSSDFPISSVHYEMRTDPDTVVGTNADGTPIYAPWPIYYFKIPDIDFSDELIIEGQTLKVHFLSGHLQGREFELAYHSTSKEYEIVTDRESGAVKLPNETLMPQDGDTVILFNIQMPDEYVTSAENRLAEALETYVNETILADTYTYSFPSNPVAFAKESIALTVGQKVTLNYVFGTLDTRVLSVEFPLYAPSKMEISVGENTPKGKLETIETETVNASSQIEIIQAYNNAAKTIQNQLNRATQIMAEGLAKLGNMWYIDKSQDTTADKSDSSKWIVRTSYPVSTDQWIAQFGIYTGGEGGGSGGGTLYHDQLEHLDWPDQHPIAAIIGLQAALEGKLNTSAIASWALQPEKPSYTWSEISGKPSAFTPSAHTHLMNDVTGLASALAGKLDTSHASDTTLHKTAAERAVLAMLSVDTDGNLKIDGDAYTTGWLAQLGAATGEGGGSGSGTMYHDQLEHLDWPNQHPIEAITGLQEALNGKLATSAISAWALQPEKPSYTWAEISGKPSAFTPAAHTHGMAEINGLSAALAEKLGVDHASDTTLHLTAGQRAVLAMLSIDTDGNLKIDGNAYATGWLSQLGAGTGGGESGGGTLYHDQLEHLDYPDQHPIAAIAGLQSALDAKANSSLLAGAILGKGWDSSLNTTEVGTGVQRLSEGSSTVGPYISFGHSGYIAQLTVGYTDYSGYSDMLRYRVRNGESASWTDWKTIWHSGNFNPDSKLGKNEKAADSTLFDGYGEAKFWRKDRKTVDLGAGLANLPVESGSYIVYSSGWTGSAFVFNASASNSGLAFYRPGGGNYRPQLIIGLDSAPTKWTNLGELVVKSDLTSYLPLTSGTLTNYLTINSGTNYVGLVLKNNYSGLSNLGGIHVGGNNDLILRAYPNGGSDLGHGTDLRLRYGGNITWNGSTIWHAGNDGANSGLDADLLDGRHASEFWGHFLTTIDASALSEDYYYPVTILVPSASRMRISVIVALNSGTKPSWSTHAQGFSCRFIEEVSGDGWGTISPNRLILDSTYKFADKNPIGEVWQMTNSNNEVIAVRGGGKYFFYTTRATTITLRTTSFTSGGQTAAPKPVSSLTPAPHKSGAGLVGLSTLYCNSIVIGGHTITWDSTNNALKIDGNVYTTGSITQLKS